MFWRIVRQIARRSLQAAQYLSTGTRVLLEGKNVEVGEHAEAQTWGVAPQFPTLQHGDCAVCFVCLLPSYFREVKLYEDIRLQIVISRISSEIGSHKNLK